MITASTILIDDFKDEILTILEPFNARKKWDKTKHNLRREFVALLKAKQYISFMSGHTRYLVSKVGSSYLYDVPLYKRGYLSNFKGKRVRIVCTDSGSHSWRGYMAGVISDSPPEKIVKKLNYKYSFPEYVDSHKILYKSPRFMVLEPNKSIIILANADPSGYVQLSGFCSILVDGKRRSPIATLSRNADGSVKGKRIGRYSLEKVYPSLREAIDDLKY